MIKAARNIGLGSAIAITAFLGFFVVFPTVSVISDGFSAKLLFDALSDARVLRAIRFTLFQATISTTISVLIGLPLAVAFTHYKFRFSNLIRSFVTIPFLMPTVVVAIAINSISNGKHPVIAIIAAHVYFNIAIVVRIVESRLRAIGTKYTEASFTLGHRPTLTLFKVTARLCAGAIINAASLIFVFCVTSFGVVKILGGLKYSTLEVEIYIRAIQLGDLGTASALSLLQIIFVAIVLFASSSYARQNRSLPAIKSNRLSTSFTTKIAIFLIGLAFLQPLISVAIRSVTSHGQFTLSGWHQMESHVIKNSFEVALVATILTILLTCLATFAVSYLKGVGRMVSSLSAMPILVSSVILGLGAITTFDAPPIDFRASKLLLPIFHSIIALPICLRVMRGPLSQITEDQRSAAATLGESPMRTWLRLDIRALRVALPAVTALSSCVSLGEFGATSILSRRDSQTIPLEIARLLGRPGDINQLHAYALATLLAFFVFVIVYGLDSINA